MNTAVVDFIEELFADENISYSATTNHYSLDTIGSGVRGQDIQIKISDYNMPLKENISALLDKCRLLHTYLSSYFLECQCIKGFDIYDRIDCFDDKSKMYGSHFESVENRYTQTKNSMFISRLVLDNTDAGEKVEYPLNSEYVEYNYVFPKLSKDLKKGASGK